MAGRNFQLEMMVVKLSFHDNFVLAFRNRPCFCTKFSDKREQTEKKWLKCVYRSLKFNRRHETAKNWRIFLSISIHFVLRGGGDGFRVFLESVRLSAIRFDSTSLSYLHLEPHVVLVDALVVFDERTWITHAMSCRILTDADCWSRGSSIRRITAGDTMRRAVSQYN